jgi:hypothetical protein
MADKVNSALLSKTAKQSASQSEAAMLGAYKFLARVSTTMRLPKVNGGANCILSCFGGV